MAVSWVLCFPRRSWQCYNSKTAIKSDDDYFYGYISSYSILEKSFKRDKVLSDKDGEKDNPSLSEDAIQSRTKCVSTRSVSRTDAGCASGVFVLLINSLFEFIGCQLSEGCCEGDCLVAFNCDKIYVPVSFKFVTDIKG